MKIRIGNVFFALSCLYPLIAKADTTKTVYEKWPSPTPWLHDRYNDFLDNMPNNSIAVEVGVQEGTFASYMLKKTNPKKLFLIDCWQHQDPKIYDDDEANIADNLQEQLYRSTVNRFARDRRVVVIREFSKTAAAQFEDESVDWVYIDANHSYEAARDDISTWWPKVKKGGTLSGHDYVIRSSFGVVQAVNEFLIENNLTLSHLTVEEGTYDSWAVKKPD